MVENLGWHEVDGLWIQVERHQGRLLLNKQFLSAFFLKEITCVTNAVKKHIGLAPDYTIPLFAGFILILRSTRGYLRQLSLQRRNHQVH